MTMVENPGLSIIVLNYDDENNLERLLSSFAEKNSYHPFEFIIVSHKSHSNTESIIKKWTSKLFINHIKRDEIHSQASSNN